MRSIIKICPKRLFLSLAYAYLGKAQSIQVAIFKETAKTKSLYSIQPFTGAGKTRELICYKLWSPKEYNHESSNGTKITLDIPVSTKRKKPLVNTFSGQKQEIKSQTG
jgi:hypothetical protein